MAVMAFAGMSVAQDIWSCGTYTSNGIQQAAVFKNNTLLYYSSFSSGFKGDSPGVDVYDGDVYWVRNSCYSNDSFHYADVMKNGDMYLNSPTGEGRHIYDLYRSPASESLFSVGCMTVNGVKTAVIWMNDNPNPLGQMGDGIYESKAYGVTTTPVDAYVYSVGIQFTNNNFHGMLWKGSSVFHTFNYGTCIYDICYYNGYLWTVGIDGTTVKVWKTNVTDGATEEQFVINATITDAPDRTKIYIDDAGNIFVVAIVGSYDGVFKNGTLLYYSTNGCFTSVVANSDGVYYAGLEDGVGKIWKDGSVLYAPSSNCIRISDIFFDEPDCHNSEIRSLPFNDSFESGDTEWPCWTKIDVDHNNSTNISFWSRGSKGGAFGSAFPLPYTGNYCAWHQWSPNAQEGWLISPRLFLQPGQDYNRLTFTSNETDSGDYQGVWISTSDPAMGSFTEIWQQTNPTDSWKHVTIDLSAYQGYAIYIAFKYTSPGHGFAWFIDDVSVTEGFFPCGTATTPYIYDFSDGFGSCWTAYDADMSGDQYCWRFTSGGSNAGCLYHPSGPSGEPQTGWLFSPRVQLPSDNNNYTLRFKTWNIALESMDETHTAWIAVDKTGSYSPDDYTQIWQEPSFNSEWSTYTVDLTPYKGHTVSIAFKYVGTSAHTWFVDDFSITQEATPVEYTITTGVNSPGAGTVSGGGTYPAGATVTLTATPNTGYSFIGWDDSNTDNPRSITVTGDEVYIANFAPIAPTYYTITVESANPAMGTVSGGGTFLSGTETTLTATPNTGYYFIGWDDGNADNPRSITVTQNATYIAQFATNPVLTFTLNVLCNTAQGSTVGSGTYTAGSTVNIVAVPNAGFEFDKWNDNNTENPRQVTVNDNMTFVAFFKSVGVDENDGRLLAIYPNPASDFIRIEGVGDDSEVYIYNAMGALVKTANAGADSKIGIGDLNAGIYLLRCGNASLRFVKEQ